MKSLTVISYDIPDDRRRAKLAKALEDFGDRVQYSVFEAWLDSGEIQKLEALILRKIDASADSVRLYRLCAACKAQLKLLGRSPSSEIADAYVL